jgi:hypothetical protein
VVAAAAAAGRAAGPTNPSPPGINRLWCTANGER